MTPLDIGRVVREAREQKGLSQDELAATANVRTKFLAKLEDGDTSGQVAKALAVLDSLGIKVSLQPPGGAD
ncbi:helix-turn-helix domain-containing protein [Bauldia sp.]|uniref:helix-turn-helix domain-containing protein n=1 Tax=Bauldia sp. TaxID=2575872 RepID=UPI003BAB866C